MITQRPAKAFHKNSKLDQNDAPRLHVLRQTFGQATRGGMFALAGLLSTTSLGFAQVVTPGELPTGGSVASGSAHFDYSQPNHLEITQGSHNAVIDWNSFNIGQAASTNFNQTQGSSSIAVNRVHDGSPSQILGSLTANGNVIVLNQNGVFFGESAKVDVGGLIASTGELDVDAFKDNGTVKLTNINAKGGSVINKGQISVKDGGLAAFVAPNVVNNGIITAKLGKVALAAGADKATVDLYGDGLVELALDDKASKALIENTGTIQADGGTVAITVKAAKEIADSVINMDGVVEANTIGTKGGKIILGATNADISVTGKINAKGGKGQVAVRSNKNITVANTSAINADAGQKGDGGTIELVAHGVNTFKGTAFARGGAESGNGGFVNVSGYDGLDYQGLVDLTAAYGSLGNLLLDPRFTIIHSGPVLPGIFQQYILSSGVLAAQLRFSNVTLQADEFIDVGARSSYNVSTGNVIGDVILNAFLNTLPTGNINVSDFFGTTNGNLTLQSNTVNVNRNLTMGNGGVTINANTANLNARIFDKNGVTLTAAKLGGTVTNVNVLSSNALIQQGISVAKTSGATVEVGDGTYNENVTINKSLKLQSKNGRGATTINGQAAGSEQGAVYITAGTNNVQVGDTGKGFTIKGLNGNGASEKSAVYIQGNNDGSKIIGNNIVAQGDGGFMTEYSAVINNLTIDGNIFSGQTFEGANPSGIGSSTQFNVGNNVPRQLVVIGGGQGGGNTSNVTFTNNELTGKTGGISTDNGTSNQGNFLATIDAKTATITGNTFAGTTTGNGSLRVRGTNTKVAGNTFKTVGLSGSAVHFYGSDTIYGPTSQSDIIAVWDNNTFIGNATVTDNDVLGGYGVIGRTIQGAVDLAVNTGATVYVNDGTYDENVTINKSNLKVISRNGRGVTTIQGQQNGSEEATVTIASNADNVQIGDAGKGFHIIGLDGTPASERAGIYLQGAHNGVTIKGNRVTAVGDEALLSQYGFTTNNLLIDGNIFDGTTFTGADGAWGLGDQFTVPNVPRQLVALNLGVQNVTFSNNNVIGNAGNRQLVAIEGTNLSVFGNTFDGLSTASALRVRGSNVSVYNNTIDGNGRGIGIESDKNGVNLTIGNTNPLLGNVINNTGSHGIAISGATGTTIIQNNDIGLLGGAQNIKGDGIYVASTSGAQIKGNTISNTQSTGQDIGSGIFVNNSNNAVIGGFAAADANTLTNIDWDGIKISNSDGVQILGNTLDTIKRVGIYAGNMSNGTIDSNIVSNAKLYGAIYTEGGQNLWIANNDIDHSAETGILVKNAGGNFNIVLNNKIDFTGEQIGGGESSGDGVRIVNAANLLVADNKIGANGGGINGNGVYVASSNGSQILANVITGVNQNGIHAFNNDDAQIKQNTITNAKMNGIYVQDGARTLIGGSTYGQGNTITGSVQNGIFVEGSGFGPTLEGQDHVISFNTIGASQANGIRLQSAFNADVIANRINGSNQAGIITKQSGSVLIDRNVINQTNSNGIGLELSDDASVTNNVLTNVSGDGINLYYGSHNALIATNTISAAQNGVALYTAGGQNNNGATIRANTITGGTNGVFVDSNDDVTIDGNTITNSSQNGVSTVNAGGLDIISNIIANAGLNGIRVFNSADAVVGGVGVGNTINKTNGGWGYAGILIEQGSGADVIANMINDSNGDGIRLQQTASASVENNIINRSAQSGVAAKQSASAEIIGNIIDQTNVHGVSLELSDNAKVDGNAISNTLGNGIDLYYGNQNAEISTNVIHGVQHGIHLDTAGGQTNNNARIQENVIYDTAKDAIFVNSATGTGIYDNLIGYTAVGVVGTAENIHGDGIKVINANGTALVQTDIGGNTIANTKSMAFDNGSGVQVLNSNYVTVRTNTINNTQWDGIRLYQVANGTVDRNAIDTVSRVGIYLGQVNATAITNNTIRNNQLAGSGSIMADFGSNLTIADNIITDAAGHGIKLSQVGGTNVVDSNTIDRVAQDGIRSDSTNNTTISDNDIGTNGFVNGHGVFVSDSTNVQLTDNTISNVDGHGLYFAGLNNGTVALAGNTVTSKAGKVGGRFESGIIDLTSANINTFNGGMVGLQFDPLSDANAAGLVLVNDGNPGFGGTIGQTAFVGQTQYYVELQNGAFFNPGTPTLMNGYNATFDGQQANAMNNVAYNALLGKIHDYLDIGTLGLFFPLRPGADINDILPEQTFLQSGIFRSPLLTITGLPFAPGAVIPANALAQLNAAALNNLASAAGGEQVGQSAQRTGQAAQFASQLNSVETAAGETTVGCWGGVYNSLNSQSAPVTYNFNASPISQLADQARCGTI